MKIRVRAAGLLVKDSAILLVKHKHRASGQIWWTPPGGGLESQDASIIETVQRECLEEAGLQVEVGHLFYIREFIQQRRKIKHLELFFWIPSWQGQASLEHLPEADRGHVLEAVWLPKDQLADKMILPEELKAQFWSDIEKTDRPCSHLGALGCAFEKKAH